MSHIYVVEDDKNISEIEGYALKNAGHNVVECSNGKEFHKAVQERIPDLILLDIMLPDEDGLEILTKLRSSPETRRIPVIMVTAKSSEIDKVKGLDMGADDYLTKPFGVMELISRVKALLRRSGGMEEEKFISGYCRQLDASRMVEVVAENGEIAEVDCCYGSCVYQGSCLIAKEIDGMKA